MRPHVRLVWLAMRPGCDATTWRQFCRLHLHRLAARLHTEHVLLLQVPNARIVLDERDADTACRYAWSVVGEEVFTESPLADTDSAPPETGALWGIHWRTTLQLDELATRDALSRLAGQLDARLDGFPKDAVIERAYYLARVNYQIIGMHAGRALVLAAGIPEA